MTTIVDDDFLSSSRVQGSASWRGAGADQHLNTTSRAVELAGSALAEKAMPHLALCFAALFGESPGVAAAAAAAAAVAGGGEKGPGRAEKLRGRLLGALEVRACVAGGFCGCCFGCCSLRPILDTRVVSVLFWLFCPRPCAFNRDSRAVALHGFSAVQLQRSKHHTAFAATAATGASNSQTFGIYDPPPAPKPAPATPKPSPEVASATTTTSSPPPSAAGEASAAVYTTGPTVPTAASPSQAKAESSESLVGKKGGVADDASLPPKKEQAEPLAGEVAAVAAANGQERERYF